jgi:ABC-type sulfate transport system permease subunit
VGPFLEHVLDPDFAHATKMTLMLAAVSVPLNTVFGTVAAILITRNEFPGKVLLLSLLDMPFSISPVVTGLMLTLLYGRCVRAAGRRAGGGGALTAADRPRPAPTGFAWPGSTGSASACAAALWLASPAARPPPRHLIPPPPPNKRSGWFSQAIAEHGFNIVFAFPGARLGRAAPGAACVRGLDRGRRERLRIRRRLALGARRAARPPDPFPRPPRPLSLSTPKGMALATMFVTMPFVVRELIPTLEQMDLSQEEAARTLGANPLQVHGGPGALGLGGSLGLRPVPCARASKCPHTPLPPPPRPQVFWHVTLPNIRWGLLYGVILTNARAMGEFGAVSVISGEAGRAGGGAGAARCAGARQGRRGRSREAGLGGGRAAGPLLPGQGARWASSAPSASSRVGRPGWGADRPRGRGGLGRRGGGWPPGSRLGAARSRRLDRA